MSFLTLFSAPYSAKIPMPIDWGISCSRPVSERTTLAGTVIRQAAAKVVSMCAPALSADVPTDVAEQVRSIDESSTTCFLADGTDVYEATIDAQIKGSRMPGRKNVSIKFGIVRKL